MVVFFRYDSEIPRKLGSMPARRRRSQRCGRGRLRSVDGVQSKHNFTLWVARGPCPL